jgi:hypothetical protein
VRVGVEVARYRGEVPVVLARKPFVSEAGHR